jgi:hypothetical protein
MKVRISAENRYHLPIPGDNSPSHKQSAKFVADGALSTAAVFNSLVRKLKGCPETVVFGQYRSSKTLRS